MAKSGPIILIEDDAEDIEIFQDALHELGIANELRCFSTCPEALGHLLAMPHSPFIIFCDMNLPKMSGIEFKRCIDSDPGLRKKSIPFIFYSTSTDPSIVAEAYLEMTVQGFFAKKNNFEEIKHALRLITDYWQLCKHPNW